MMRIWDRITLFAFSLVLMAHTFIWPEEKICPSFYVFAILCVADMILGQLYELVNIKKEILREMRKQK